MPYGVKPIFFVDLSTMEMAATGWIASMRTAWRHTMRDSHCFRLFDQTIIAARSPLRVKTGKARVEHLLSALTLIADV
jgi:hypothetical protein